MQGNKTGSNIWRIDKYLLMNKEVRARLHKEIEIFFQANGGTLDKIILWETFKVYVQGILISQKAYLRKKKVVVVGEGLKKN